MHTKNHPEGNPERDAPKLTTLLQGLRSIGKECIEMVRDLTTIEARVDALLTTDVEHEILERFYEEFDRLREEHTWKIQTLKGREIAQRALNTILAMHYPYLVPENDDLLARHVRTRLLTKLGYLPASLS